MMSGETERFDCPECNAEFEVTREPKCKGKTPQMGDEDLSVEWCPFCGEAIPSPDDKDDDDEK